MSLFKSIMIIIGCSLFYGCSKCGDKPLNDVRIRIQNDLDLDLESILIGSTMYRGNDSFASCTMTEGFKDVAQGALTEYTITYGNHMGYSGVRIQWHDETRDASNATTDYDSIYVAELFKNGAVEDSVTNVYNGKMHYGLSLPDGDYTIILKSMLPTKNPVIEVEINKDL